MFFLKHKYGFERNDTQTETLRWKTYDFPFMHVGLL